MLRVWAYGHWFRSVIVAGVILSLIAITMAGWAYLASVALHTGELSIDAALRALDHGHYDEARAAVGRMLKSGLLPRSEYGGPLFVLGAVKMKDAESQSSADHRRVEYLVASRYLKEARAHGIPAERTAEALFMLGKSLVESGQFDEGLQTLDELLAEQAPSDKALNLEVHWCLGETCLLMPNPKVDKALEHYNILLASPELTKQQRAATLVQQAECLARLDRFDEARQSVTEIPADAAPPTAIDLARAKITLDELDSTLQKAATSERETIISNSAPQLDEAIKLLQA
ncbi:MAG: hypothetical protein WD229_15925, partial [Pirellulales bacterium]